MLSYKKKLFNLSKQRFCRARLNYMSLSAPILDSTFLVLLLLFSLLVEIEVNLGIES